METGLCFASYVSWQRALSAHAVVRRGCCCMGAEQQSIVISCSPDPQQQTRNSGVQRANGTYGRIPHCNIVSILCRQCQTADMLIFFSKWKHKSLSVCIDSQKTDKLITVACLSLILMFPSGLWNSTSYTHIHVSVSDYTKRRLIPHTCTNTRYSAYKKIVVVQ